MDIFWDTFLRLLVQWKPFDWTITIYCCAFRWQAICRIPTHIHPKTHPTPLSRHPPNILPSIVTLPLWFVNGKPAALPPSSFNSPCPLSCDHAALRSFTHIYPASNVYSHGYNCNMCNYLACGYLSIVCVCLFDLLIVFFSSHTELVNQYVSSHQRAFIWYEIINIMLFSACTLLIKIQ